MDGGNGPGGGAADGARPAVAIIGAGPAGLTAGYLLSERDVPVVILESDPAHVGGMARTVEYKGFRVDIGGHRFSSNSHAVEDLWREILPDGLLKRPWRARIYHEGKFFSYPLQLPEVLQKLNPLELALCTLSWINAWTFPARRVDNFEDWMSNQFGRRLFSIFFKGYTEKLFGTSCREISVDWATQRINDIVLGKGIRNAVFPYGVGPGGGPLFFNPLGHSFSYPRLGPGMMWEACANKIRANGGCILMGASVTGCVYEEGSRKWQVRYRCASMGDDTLNVEHLISSAPISQLICGLTPRASEEALRAATSLRYRDLLTVAVILKDRYRLNDNWIYVHDPTVKAARVLNYKFWSPAMVPDPAMTCYGLEYFCWEGDGVWISRDEILLELAGRDLAQMGLIRNPNEIRDGCVIRQRKAYPVYDEDYDRNVAVVRAELAQRFPNLHLAGRNGMHKHNAQDHAMMTAMLCVGNILANRQVYDPWAVNQGSQYHTVAVVGGETAWSGEKSRSAAVRAQQSPRARNRVRRIAAWRNDWPRRNREF